MASVTLEHLSKIYSNGFVSVNDVSLRVDNGEFITLHGPSGCGKSTILRMIGGLEDITSGKIYLSDELLNDILPRDRRLAMAFQNYTLYKHFNAYDNMALGLRLRDFPRNIICNKRSFGSPHIRQKDRIYERRQNNRYRITSGIGYFLVSFTTF